MPNKHFNFITATTLILSLLLTPIAEAKRIGGGGSRGMSRSYSGQNYQRSPSYQPQSQPQPSYQPRQQPQQGNSGSGVGKMIGAGVAGAAIGALAGHALANNQNDKDNGTTAAPSANMASNVASASTPATTADHQATPEQQKNGFNWLWLILLAIAGVFLFRRFKNNSQNNQTPASNQFSQPTSSNYNKPSSGSTNNIFGQNLNGNNNQSNTTLPDGTSSEAFLRFARQRFNHVQSMNNRSNLEEIRRYFTPEMFADIKEDIIQNQDIAEFSDLKTDLVGSAQENNQYIAGVRFSGLVSEELGSQPTLFSEIWHFVKPMDNQQSEWLIAGIQQD